MQLNAFDQVRYKKTLHVTLLMAYADNGSFIDLTDMVDATGKLNWTAGKGNWNLYAIFQGWR